MVNHRSADERADRLDYCYPFRGRAEWRFAAARVSIPRQIVEISPIGKRAARLKRREVRRIQGCGNDSTLEVPTMAARKKRKSKAGWGGKRSGAGRPKGSGTGPSPGARINRVVAMLSNDELKALKRIAREQKLPLGTAAYRIIARALKRNG
jgi:hypothetical protein